MRRAAVTLFFILFYITAIPAVTDDQDGFLDAPTNLKVTRMSNTRYLLTWKFTKPNNVTLRDIMFLIRLSQDNVPRRTWHYSWEKEPFSLPLYNLEMNTDYSISIYAKSKNFKDSEVKKLFFITPGRAWPKPIILNVTSLSVDGKSANYTVRWSLSDDGEDYADSYELELCDPDCKSKVFDGSVSEAQVSINPGRIFTLEVIALFAHDGVWKQRRSSAKYKGVGAIGIPETVDGLLKHEQTGNLVELRWKPAEFSLIPTFYEVIVVDPLNGTSMSVRVVYEPTVTMELPKLLGVYYKVLIRAAKFGDEKKPVSSLQGVTILQRNRPSKPTHYIITDGTSNWTSIKIIGDGPETGSILQIEDSEKKSIELLSEHGTATLRNMELCVPRNFTASFCLELEDSGSLYCGESTEFTVESSPSRCECEAGPPPPLHGPPPSPSHLCTMTLRCTTPEAQEHEEFFMGWSADAPEFYDGEEHWWLDIET